MNTTTLKILLASMTFSLLISVPASAASSQQTWSTLMEQYTQTQNEQFNAQDNVDSFETYLAEHPDNALAELYTASSYCFIGRDAWMPWNKLDAANTCIDKMETALTHIEQQYPDNSEQRLRSYLTFGLTGAALPDRFQMYQVSQDILNKAKNHPAFSRLPEKLQLQVFNILSGKQ
ncbi:hypothetical protein [Psychromonas ossibalaenae]|uniref:hypothetical protein n=1 Tax=Psychromonas ossibalaenae TaxID=444922 RepID=UPI00036D58DA|nr:hypothetical protein [Psychromonas ossibalaenae]